MEHHLVKEQTDDFNQRLQEESAEQQVLDCIMCFLHSVNELLKLAKQTSAELCTEK